MAEKEGKGGAILGGALLAILAGGAKLCTRVGDNVVTAGARVGDDVISGARVGDEAAEAATSGARGLNAAEGTRAATGSEDLAGEGTRTAAEVAVEVGTRLEVDTGSGEE